MTSKPQNHKKPTSDNPWDVPPQSTLGDAGPDEIYRSVGMALSAWENLEERLSIVFAILSESGSTGAMMAYGALVAHSMRSDMLKWAGEAYFSHFPDHKEDFKRLMLEISKMSGRRNDIAHGVCRVPDDGDNSQGFYLIPPFYNMNKGGLSFRDRKYAYTSQQIMLFAFHFMVYDQKVQELIGKMMK